MCTSPFWRGCFVVVEGSAVVVMEALVVVDVADDVAPLMAVVVEVFGSWDFWMDRMECWMSKNCRFSRMSCCLSMICGVGDVRLRTCTCTHFRAHTYTHTHTSISLSPYLFKSVSASVYLSICLSVYLLSSSICLSIYLMCMSICLFVCLSIHIHMRTQGTHTRAHAHTHTHTHTHARTHSQIRKHVMEYTKAYNISSTMQTEVTFTKTTIVSGKAIAPTATRNQYT